MDRIQQKQESRLQPKLSIIFKQQVNRIPQSFGTFYDGEGKYCALAAVSKYFGHDVKAHKMINDAIASSADLIPLTVIDRIEGCVPTRGNEEYPHCNCKTKNYYHYSLISLLIHLNDYHQMTFLEIGNWLESKGL
jgi:hypothetical protein